MKNINWQTGAELFVDAIASDNATPGGGAAAAVAGATGAGLAMMAIAITLKMKATPAEDKKDLNKYLDDLMLLRDELKAAAQADAKAYGAVVSARKLPKDTKERREALKESLMLSVQAPVNTAKKALAALEKAQEIEGKISKLLISDLACSKIFLRASIACGIENIKANIPYIEDNLKPKLEETINFLSKFC
ncbi:MAG: cyclodeaminase/cyclohydrolase family protein [Elusimicrobiota bacterium]|jgi:formiminotetrahydrofolate cyclodeaminase|nr:cyclodeaminase/cyclohydrolase family protein [Elusimicrobiota bacterium]